MNFAFSTVPVDGKALLGDRAFTGTVMTKLVSCLCTGPAFERLIDLNYRATRFNGSILKPGVMKTHHIVPHKTEVIVMLRKII